MQLWPPCHSVCHQGFRSSEPRTGGTEQIHIMPHLPSPFLEPRARCCLVDPGCTGSQVSLVATLHCPPLPGHPSVAKQEKRLPCSGVQHPSCHRLPPRLPELSPALRGQEPRQPGARREPKTQMRLRLARGRAARPAGPEERGAGTAPGADR